jgi:DNA-binding GntR family transcriptional regulator
MSARIPSVVSDHVLGDPIRAGLRSALRHEVLEGRLSPGAIVRPLELAQSMGVSATPLREALIELTRDGLLEARPRRGFAVRPLTAEEALELYPVLADLESLAVRSSPPAASTLDRLDELNQSMADTSGSIDIHELDFRWHTLLTSASENRVLEELLALVRGRVRRYEVAYFRFGGSVPDSVRQHRAVTALLREGKTEAAIDVLVSNWLSGLKLLVEWLRSMTSDEVSEAPAGSDRA